MAGMKQARNKENNGKCHEKKAQLAQFTLRFFRPL